VKSEWEEITRPKLVVDSEIPIDESIGKILAYLGGSGESNPAGKAEL